MFTEAQQEILKDELVNDPTSKGWSEMTDLEVCEEINKDPIIDNPETAPKVLQYNLTESIDPLTSSTTILNVIPTAELVGVKTDSSGIGKLFYDRLLNFEATNKKIDIASSTFTEAVAYCKTQNFISDETVTLLTATTEVTDATKWHSQVTSPSRAKDLGIFPATVVDITFIRSTL